METLPSVTGRGFVFSGQCSGSPRRPVCYGLLGKRHHPVDRAEHGPQRAWQLDRSLYGACVETTIQAPASPCRRCSLKSLGFIGAQSRYPLEIMRKPVSLCTCGIVASSAAAWIAAALLWLGWQAMCSACWRGTRDHWPLMPFADQVPSKPHIRQCCPEGQITPVRGDLVQPANAAGPL